MKKRTSLEEIYWKEAKQTINEGLARLLKSIEPNLNAMLYPKTGKPHV